MKSFKDTEYGDLTGRVYEGDVDVICKSIESLKGCPKIVKGKFVCSYCQYLETLEGAPEIVEDYFICKICENLKALECGTKLVKGFFNCSECNSIKNLKGAPEIVEGDFFCFWCDDLESVEGAPRKCKTFNCVGCDKLTTLDPLLKCDIEKVVADEHLLEDYYKKKAAIKKHGYDKAMEVIEMMNDLI